MDERLREAIRTFDAGPDEASGLALLRAAQRVGDRALALRAVEGLADVRRWDALADGTRRAVGEAVASFDPGITFRGVDEHALGGQRHHVAKLWLGGLELALIPGGEVRLGWEGDLGPLAAELPRLDLSPPRTVTLRPFLIETLRELTVDELLGGDLEHDDLFAAIEAAVLEDGFRLPTPDEWEHACAAGARTFFRWGDAWPPRVPGAHRRPNAFGLQYEPCAGEHTSDRRVVYQGGLELDLDAEAPWWLLGTFCRLRPASPRSHAARRAVVRRALTIG